MAICMFTVQPRFTRGCRAQSHAEPHRSRQDREFGDLLAILKNEQHAWINLYSFDQLSKARPAHDRCGRNDYRSSSGPLHLEQQWPHAGIAVPLPDDADLLDFLLAAAPMEPTRELILADNPAKLYGWPVEG